MISGLLPEGAQPPTYFDKGPNPDAWGNGLYNDGSTVWDLVYTGANAQILAGWLAETTIRKTAYVNWLSMGCQGPQPPQLTAMQVSQHQDRVTTAYAAGFSDAEGCWYFHHAKSGKWRSSLRFEITQTGCPAILSLIQTWALRNNIRMSIRGGKLRCIRNAAVSAFLHLVVMGGFMIRKGFKGWAVYEAWFKGRNGALKVITNYPLLYKPTSNPGQCGVNVNPRALLASNSALYMRYGPCKVKRSVTVHGFARKQAHADVMVHRLIGNRKFAANLQIANMAPSFAQWA